MMKPKFSQKLEFLDVKPAHIGMVVILSFFAAVTESFGLAILLPILEFLETGANHSLLLERNEFWKYIFEIFDFVGLDVSLYSLLGTAIILLTIRSCVHYSRQIYNAWLQQNMSHAARFGIIKSHIQMRFCEFEKNSTSQLINILSNELPRATGSFYIWLQLFSSLFMFAGLLSLLLLLSPLLTGLAILLIFCTSLVILFAIRNTKHTSFNASKANKSFAESFGQMFQLLKFVKLSSLEEDTISNIRQESDEIRKQFFKLANYKALIDLYIEPVVIFSGSVVLVVAIEALQLSLSETGLFMLVLLRMLPISKTLHQSYQSFAAAAGSRRILFDTYFWANSIAEQNTGTEKLKEPVSIHFKDVNFRYNENQLVLNKVNLSFQKGKISALIGPAGAGKSTIIELMLRIYEPESGYIYFGNDKIESLDLVSLRLNISLVTQDSYFIEGTIRENLTISNSELQDEQILNTIQKVFGQKFSDDFPEQLDTQIGFCGFRLSGGQRQMLALTRAILEDKQIIVLDEPTSALDLQSQKRITEIISSLRSDNRTIIIISHRPSTISIADTIMVLQNGRLGQSGDHETLMQSSSWYKTFFPDQMPQNH